MSGIKPKVQLSQKEREALLYAIDFLDGQAAGADEEPAKRIFKKSSILTDLFNRTTPIRRLKK